MSLSSNTLFHFTGKLDNVTNILQQEFHPNFSLEDFNVITPKRMKFPQLEFAVPMVSFCDIPLSQVSKHLGFYGNYGIGLRKEWGMKHGIAPVLYTYKGSRLARQLYSMVIEINKLANKGLAAKRAQDHFYDLSCFVKPYQGRAFRSGHLMPKRRFYDEREWRYVPRIASGSYRYGIMKEEFLDDAFRRKANNNLWAKFTVHFSPADIKYIIVASEHEILTMIHIVEAVKTRFPSDQVRTMISRIVSVEQIQDDF